MDKDRYIGKLLDNRYEILENIGTGGMAVVYKARCHRLNRLVAIKILKDENLQDEDFCRRFHAEGQAVGMLNHPNIVSVYDVSTSGDAEYIVMELIDGISLKQYMEKKGVLNWKETLHFATQIAKALEHAHSRGLVHRDIKPHNVMVLKNGSVRVTDFGIARVMSNSNTLTKETLGSVHYISPEQAKGGLVDHRSDLYSLGVVMYEMITGRTPFDGESPVSVAIQHIAGGAIKPSVINPNIPKGLEQIILKAMAPNLKNRYANAAALLADLDTFRKEPTMVFPVEPAVNQPPVTFEPKPEQPKPAEKPQAAPRRRVVEEDSAPVTEAAIQEAIKRKKRQKRERDYANDRLIRSRIATIAVIACSIVMVVAVLIFLSMLVGTEETPMQPEQVEVPNLVGIDYEFVPKDYDLKIVIQMQAYNDEYSAGKIINQLPEAGEKVDAGRTVYVTVSLGPKPPDELMKDLQNYTKAEAQRYLQDLNLDIKWIFHETYHDTIAAGKVISTDPAAGQVLRKGQKVTLTVSLGKEQMLQQMPDLIQGIYKDKNNATSIMNAKGFVNVEWRPINSLLPENTIISQSVTAGTMVDVTTHIIIEYSNGIPPEKPTVTIRYTFGNLPAEGECTVTLYTEEDGYITKKKADGETSVTFELTGKGKKTYTVFINNEGQPDLVIDFDEYAD